MHHVNILCHKYTTKICLINLEFHNSFHELFQILSLSVSLCICIYEFYSIKPSHFTKTKIYVKLDPKAANNAQSYYLKSGTITHNGVIYPQKF